MTPTPIQKPRGPLPRFGPPASSPAWERETNKCIGREVTVTQYLGVGADGVPVFEQYTGICVAIQSTHLSVILMTEDEKVLVKNVASIRRRRAKNNPPAKSDTLALGEVLAEALKKGAPE